MSSNSLQGNRWHIAMCNLVYPAFLGTMIYETVGKVSPNKAGPLLLTIHAILLSALLFHFVIDYLYTVVNDERTDYGPLSWLFDLAAVAMLYLAVKSINIENDTVAIPGVGDRSALFSDPVFLLASAKLASLSWEMVRRTLSRQPMSNFAVTTDFGFLLFYWALFGFAEKVEVPILVLVLLLDSGTYLLHDFIRRNPKYDPFRKLYTPIREA